MITLIVNEQSHKVIDSIDRTIEWTFFGGSVCQPGKVAAANVSHEKRQCVKVQRAFGSEEEIDSEQTDRSQNVEDILRSHPSPAWSSVAGKEPLPGFDGHKPAVPGPIPYCPPTRFIPVSRSKIFGTIVKGMMDVSVGVFYHWKGYTTGKAEEKFENTVTSRRCEERAMGMHVHDSYGQGVIQQDQQDPKHNLQGQPLNRPGNGQNEEKRVIKEYVEQRKNVGPMLEFEGLLEESFCARKSGNRSLHGVAPWLIEPADCLNARLQKDCRSRA